MKPDGAFEPITIAAQGSFFIGGQPLQVPGTFDARTGVAGNEGETFWIDQMYVQYQLPLPPAKAPLLLVHGGYSTGKAWDSTPDGREGFQTLMLRAGHPVYVVDLPRRGRSGFPSFNGAFGRLAERQIVSDSTVAAGARYASSRWRIGHEAGFEHQRFPTGAQAQFLQQLVPMLASEPAAIAATLALLLEKIGPAVLVTHSQSGLFGWLAASMTQKVLAIVSYEPGFVFPSDRMPAAIALQNGTCRAGLPVDPGHFDALARFPIQIVYGDNIPAQPVADRAADERRAQYIAAGWFAEELGRRGGDASVLHLPQIGIRGNSHFMFADANNAEIATLLARFLQDSGITSGAQRTGRAGRTAE